MASASTPVDDLKALSLADIPLEKPSQVIHVVDFESCTDQNCTLFSTQEEPHLLIGKYEIDLSQLEHRDSAVAISYTWGEFQHSQRLIGHEPSGNKIYMTLGEEWNTSDFTNRLALLSQERGFCWIDQLCIPQVDAGIRQALASIPTIYRSLDVVVLMTGAPCRCLQEHLELVQVAEEFGTTEDYHSAVQAMLQRSLKCFNFIPSSSWLGRAWTRQEMAYSRSISVAWTSSKTAPCVVIEEGEDMVSSNAAADLNPFLQLVRRKDAKEKDLFGETAMESVKRVFRNPTPVGFLQATAGVANSLASTVASHFDSYDEMRQALGEERLKRFDEVKSTFLGKVERNAIAEATNNHLKYMISAWNAFKDYIGADDSSFNRAVHTTFRFFAGATVINAGAVYHSSVTSGERDDLNRFLKSLGTLRLSGRKATKPRDYVNSVWVDCPKFQIPENFMKMDLLSLLENALEQLRDNHRVMPITSAPAGLLGASNGTALWKPSLYLKNEKISDIGQVYSVLVRHFKPVPVTNRGMVPLRIVDTEALALSSTAVDYERQLGHLPNDTAFEYLEPIVKFWPKDTIHELSMPKEFEEMMGVFEGGYKMIGYTAKFAANLFKRVPAALRSGDPLAYIRPVDNASIDQFHNDYRPLIKEQDAEFQFRANLLSSRDTEDTGESALPANKINHAKVLYWMVAEAMGLDYKMCQKFGLRLMVSQDTDLPFVGLTNCKDISRKASGRDPGDIRTICVSEGEQWSGATMYEVERVDEAGSHDSTPLYRVFGAWVPLRVAIWDRLYAIADESGGNAFIV